MKQVIVINVSNQDIPIEELKQVLPAGTIDAKYVLPYDIAIKYKQFLYPVGYIDPEVPIQEKSKEQLYEEISEKVKLELKQQEEERIKKEQEEEKLRIKLEKKEKLQKKLKSPKPLRGIKLKANKCPRKKEEVELKNQEKIDGKNSNT